MDISIIFKIAGVGIVTAIINQVLKKSDKEEIATFTNIAGLIIVLFMVVELITQLFDSLKGNRRIWGGTRRNTSMEKAITRECSLCEFVVKISRDNLSL